MNLPGYPVFRKAVLDLTGIDLDCYKGTQMERRLQTIMRRVGVPDLGAYARLLMVTPSRVKEFQDFLTINVSEWVRNPEKFDELQKSIIPELLKRSPRLKIWSAGCSNGSEPYSVAMLLDEVDPTGRHQILATDLDEEILKAARAGVYTDKDIRGVSVARRSRYFFQDGDKFIVKPELRSRVTFERQNLLSDPFPTDVDLVLCRNVVIYFTEEAKDDLYRRFHRALKPGGILFVGGTESLLKARELGYASVSPFFYRAVK
ncbi:MAG TPA: protein-glutamate O-methyltransferase CheR [Symbiobacteriaceae bacterium]|jgi:chemotaxis protein methyltransferase CheR|nr:protein-glutamate O-methyltransferase CheR [Symbiobacteriaceae bacterium]